ncbi:hypothetical protein [Lacticaseibacillus zhaodongensis]|uniref:hypothetical protein n=1 Tax=Lacticaseibacillus zhaodongensis TaxID=2668065 RepID=UPI0012D2D930|nr:hypothetical protein [Lacticaseibacillus zhaodongensis]
MVERNAQQTIKGAGSLYKLIAGYTAIFIVIMALLGYFFFSDNMLFFGIVAIVAYLYGLFNLMKKGNRQG